MLSNTKHLQPVGIHKHKHVLRSHNGKQYLYPPSPHTGNKHIPIILTHTKQTYVDMYTARAYMQNGLLNYWQDAIYCNMASTIKYILYIVKRRRF